MHLLSSKLTRKFLRAFFDENLKDQMATILNVGPMNFDAPDV